MSSPMRIGIIGCGSISNAYFGACRRFANLEVAACADLDVERAKAKGREHNTTGMSVEQLLADPSIGLVVNLTIPAAHAAIDLRILDAGKHVFSEKPFALTREEGLSIVRTAKEKNRLVGCAPDTCLGAAVQTSRKLVDAGEIGKVVAFSANMLCGGHETWHPSPEFYYQQGGGPMFDMGPYYLHALITLLGPVTSVSGAARTTWATRTITSQPKRGTVMTVEIPTHLVSILEFASGAVGTLTTSFDIKSSHTLPCIELYGTDGSLQVPDPNGTGGPVRIRNRTLKDFSEVSHTHPYREGSRGVGVADLAMAATTGRAARANDAIAMHALDIMVAIHDSAASGRRIDLTTTCERPAAMDATLPEWIV